ncbi:MAG: hypothetical protein AAGI88_06045 [Pseudomonadota bacterium]
MIRRMHYIFRRTAARTLRIGVGAFIVNLILAALVSAQSVPTRSGSEIQGPGTAESRIGDNAAGTLDFRRQRESFQEQLALITGEEESLLAQIEARRQSLKALETQESELLLALDSVAVTESSKTATFTQRFDSWVVSAFHPLSLLDPKPENSGIAGAGTDSSTGLSWSPWDDATISIGIPLMLALLWLLLRRNHHGAYLRWKTLLNPVVIALLVVFPLSAIAEIPTGSRGSLDASSLSDNLMEANRLLALSQTQRYLHSLRSYGSERRRVTVRDLDLSGSPLKPSTSVIPGTTEALILEAALHLHEGNNTNAVNSLQELAAETYEVDQAVEYSREFESSIEGVVRFLVSENEDQLAGDIFSRFGSRLANKSVIKAQLTRPPASALEFEAQESFGDRSFGDSNANGSAGTLTNIAFDASNAFAGRATNELSPIKGRGRDAAMDTSARSQQQSKQSSLQEMARFAVNENSEPLLRMAIEAASYDPGEAVDVVNALDALLDAGYKTEALQLINNAIDFYRNAPREVAGESRNAHHLALRRLSLEAFRRGLFPEAKTALVAALKPLSSRERRLLVTPLPPGTIQPWRLPEPNALVAPLYLGLIEEQAGNNDSARRRFRSENERALRALIDDSGLIAPDLLNHLTLLGSSLDTTLDRAELTEVNTLLVQLEQNRLNELRGEYAPAVTQRRNELTDLDLRISERRAQIERLQAQVALADKPEEKPGIATLLSIIRFVGLVLVCAACLTAPVCIALRYAKTKPLQKTSAFVWKAVETIGWIWMLTIFSLPAGLGAILLAQFFLASLRRDSWSPSDEDPLGILIDSVEETWPAQVETTDASASLAKEMLQRESTSSETPWSNVIELLRETRS